jgi:hypothetical protein
MKSYKIAAILAFITAFNFYVCAIINFTNGSGMAPVYLGLGFIFLWLGIVWFKKDK